MNMLKTVGVFSTVAATTMLGPKITPPAGSEFNPVLVDFWGVIVPALPIIVGVLSAFMVRVIIITSSPHRLRIYNWTVTGLAMLGAGATIHDTHYGMGPSFWIGCGFGALGVGIIEIAKSKLEALLGARPDSEGAD